MNASLEIMKCILYNYLLLCHLISFFHLATRSSRAVELIKAELQQMITYLQPEDHGA